MYNFKYLIDNDISLYCENEEERRVFIKLCRDNEYICYEHVECHFYSWSSSFKGFNCYLMNPQVENCIDFKTWSKK